MVKRRLPKRKERKANLRDLSIPETEVCLEVFKDHDGLRLDAFIAAHLSWRSKVSIQAWINEGKVRLSREGKAKKSTKVHTRDKVYISLPEPTEEIRHEEIARGLDFVYEDDHVVAVNKDPGLVVHPVSKVQNNTLIQALHWHYRHGPGFIEERKIVPKICHRLDKDTSGLMVVAKSDPARRRIQEIFEAREVKKSYRALLWGAVEFDEKVVDAPIGQAKLGYQHTRMAVRADGLRARSIFRKIAEYALGEKTVSFVEVAIETGRQHQIRVHASHLGHPILCDSLYGLGEVKLKHGDDVVLSRQALHSYSMALRHPFHDRDLELQASLPEDISRVVEHLEQGHLLSEEKENAKSEENGEGASGRDASM